MVVKTIKRNESWGWMMWRDEAIERVANTWLDIKCFIWYKKVIIKSHVLHWIELMLNYSQWFGWEKVDCKGLLNDKLLTNWQAVCSDFLGSIKTIKFLYRLFNSGIFEFDLKTINFMLSSVWMTQFKMRFLFDVK